jgi:hypothetical protein
VVVVDVVVAVVLILLLLLLLLAALNGHAEALTQPNAATTQRGTRLLLLL